MSRILLGFNIIPWNPFPGGTPPLRPYTHIYLVGLLCPFLKKNLLGGKGRENYLYIINLSKVIQFYIIFLDFFSNWYLLRFVTQPNPTPRDVQKYFNFYRQRIFGEIKAKPVGIQGDLLQIPNKIGDLPIKKGSPKKAPSFHPPPHLPLPKIQLSTSLIPR